MHAHVPTARAHARARARAHARDWVLEMPRLRCVHLVGSLVASAWRWRARSLSAWPLRPHRTFATWPSATFSLRLLTAACSEHDCALQVRSVACDPSGQWLLTGSDDGTVRLWQALTGYCRTVWDVGAKVHGVAWCPDLSLRLVSCVLENKVVLLASGVGGAAVAEAAALALEAPPVDEREGTVLTRWVAREGGGWRSRTTTSCVALRGTRGEAPGILYCSIAALNCFSGAHA